MRKNLRTCAKNSPNYKRTKTMLEFTKTKIESTKGLQPSKWDFLAEELTEPGDTAEFDPTKVSRANAAVGAARLRKLTGKKFHSGFNAISGKTFIRLRMDGEVDKDEETEN